MARKVEFLPDGKRVYAKPEDIVRVWRQFTRKVPAQYALATAQHEAGLTINEKDTEESGFVSWGIYQCSDVEARHHGFALSKEEAATTGRPFIERYTLEGCTQLFVKLAEEHLTAIIKAAKLSASDLPPDVWAYVFIAHNQGQSAALKSIGRHGLNWNAYKARNMAAAQRAVEQARIGGDRDFIQQAEAKVDFWKRVADYGDHVIDGGTYWKPEFELPKPVPNV